MQAGKLAPLAGPQPPFHYTRLDAQDELLCGKGYWRRAPDRVYEDSEEEDEDEAQPKCASGGACMVHGEMVDHLGHPPGLQQPGRSCMLAGRPFCLPTACAGPDPLLCRQQFRRAGLLIWPRSKRLLNAVHADLAQQTLRLHSMLVRWYRRLRNSYWPGVM